MPGNVVFPIPEPNQEIKWGSNFQQFGRGTVKTTISGLEGTITAPTINATAALQVNGANINTLYQHLGNYLQTPTFATYSNNVDSTFVSI